MLDGMLAGAVIALQPTNLLFCLIGVFVGTLIGVLPGIGPVATISLLLPLTIGLDPTAAIIMIAGIYYGAAYGGSTTSILVNVPGEASTVVTCIDGHQMARQGRAGSALALAAVGSFLAGTLGTVGIATVSDVVMRYAIRFGPPEYFAMMLLGIVLVVFLSSGSIPKALAMVALGLFFSQVGQDIVTGETRYTADIFELSNGIDLIPLAMGLFGISEVLLNLEHGAERSTIAEKVGSLMPSAQEWREAAAPMARGSLLGFLLGLIPGGGPALASFASYALERRVSRTPEQFGKGAVAGVAGPEAANNAAASGSFIPLLTLGLPSNAVMGLMLGAFIMHGLTPGPLLIQNHPGMFWGIVASMYVGNVLLLILNLPLIGLWVQLLRVPYRLLFPIILLLTIVGTYSVNHSVFDVYLLIFFGALGYVLRKWAFDLAPLVLAFVLGSQLEQTFRQSLMMGRGSFDAFLQRPTALVILAAAAVMLISPVLGLVRRSRTLAVKAASDAD
jgi:putative tricarboxylic transport membrane protein